MARLVRLEQPGPMKIDPATWPKDEAGNPKPFSICACGLSKKFPLCDGMHKTTSKLEEAGFLYRYDAEGKVVEKVAE
ncbi:MAG: CDGSH iron-sulfur domain-containing protein [Phycisphaerales bacterium]